MWVLDILRTKRVWIEFHNSHILSHHLPYHHRVWSVSMVLTLGFFSILCHAEHAELELSVDLPTPWTCSRHSTRCLLEKATVSATHPWSIFFASLILTASDNLTIPYFAIPFTQSHLSVSVPIRHRIKGTTIAEFIGHNLSTQGYFTSTCYVTWVCWPIR